MSNDISRRTVEIRVGGRYKLGKKIGSGSYSEIYEGLDIFQGVQVAIKLEPIKSNEIKQLLHEARLLKSIEGEGVPSMYWYGQAGEYDCMVTELLGENLEELYEFCNRSFTLKTVVMIAIEAINRIKYLHSCNYIHCDIKPQNFLSSKDDKNSVIYLIDFGLAKKYRDDISKIHISFKENKTLTGTARYASRNSHNGLEQSRRDDLESLAYVLLYFIKGKLPWQGLKEFDKVEKYNKIKEMKNNAKPSELFKDLPEEFSMYLDYCYNLRFDEEPNYKYLIKLFSDLLSKKDYEFDHVYDWNIVVSYNKIEK